MGKREKWTIDKLPDGYPKCKRRDLNNTIKDLINEFTDRSIGDGKDFINRGWKDRIIVFIQLGQSELQRRNNNTVLTISVITLIIAIIALFGSQLDNLKALSTAVIQGLLGFN